MRPLILASGSPRRRELLEGAGLSFTVFVSEADETVSPDLTPEETVLELSRHKALAAREKLREPDAVILSADTVVAVDGEILGKPEDEEDAFRMLRSLSGRTHRVYTGVTLCREEGCESFCSSTAVTFYPLTEEEIEAYIATGEPMDKAGAYGIQGRGAILVREVHGDYFTVVGLPLAETLRRIRE